VLDIPNQEDNFLNLAELASIVFVLALQVCNRVVGLRELHILVVPERNLAVGAADNQLVADIQADPVDNQTEAVDIHRIADEVDTEGYFPREAGSHNLEAVPCLCLVI